MAQASNIRVVVVEDEGLFRDLICGALSGLTGIEVVASFGDAEAAEREIPFLEADVALLDIDLGAGRNGVQLGVTLRRLRPELGIVLLSSHRDPTYLAQVPQGEGSGWSYLHKKSIGDVATLATAVQGSAAGLVVLDPQIARALKVTRKLDGAFSERTLALLELLAQGLSNAAIAERLCLAEKSVENQLSAVYRQFGIDTSDPRVQPRVQAVLHFLQGTH